MRRSTFSLAAILALACGPAFATGESSILPSGFAHERSMERATARAAKENKPVVLYYTRTQCPPCDVLQWRLKKQEVGGSYRENYVFTAVWGTSMNYTERQHYRATYDVQGAPTWIFFAPDGRYLCTSPGGFHSDEQGAALHAAVQALLKQSGTSRGPRTCM